MTDWCDFMTDLREGEDPLDRADPAEALLQDPLGTPTTHQGTVTMGCSVLGRGAEPLVRTQFLEHPPTLNFGANHLRKWIQHPQKPPIPFLFPHNPHHGGGLWGGVKELEHS